MFNIALLIYALDKYSWLFALILSAALFLHAPHVLYPKLHMNFIKYFTKWSILSKAIEHFKNLF